MGVEYSYYDAKTETYFEMGKWYGWDEGYKSESSAVSKLFMPRAVLAEVIFDYVKNFDMLRSERREYAEWLAERLADFASKTSREHVSWVNDSDDSDAVLSTCRACRREYLIPGDNCDCPDRTPKCPRLAGTRYRGDDGAMLLEPEDWTPRPKAEEDARRERMRSVLASRPSPKVREGRLYLNHGFEAHVVQGGITAINVPGPLVLRAGKHVLHAQHDKPLRVEVLPRVMGEPRGTLERVVIANADHLLVPTPLQFFNPGNISYIQGEHVTVRTGEGVDVHVTLDHEITTALYYFRAWEIVE